MKFTRRDEIWNCVEPRLHYSVFMEPGLEQIIMALTALLSGQTVMLLFKQDMERGDDWRHLSTFPKRMINISASIRVRRRIRKWSHLAGHLFRPVKSVYTGKEWPGRMVQLYDLLAGNDFHGRSVKVRLEEFPGIGKIQDNLSNSWLIEESMVNLSRFKIELLKEIHLRGGIVLNYIHCRPLSQMLEVTDLLTGSSLNIRGTLYPSSCIKLQSWILPSLPWHGFSLHVIGGKERLTIAEHAGQLRVTCSGHKGRIPGDFPVRLFKGSGPVYHPGTAISAEERILYDSEPAALKRVRCSTSLGGEDSGLTEDLVETAFDIARQTGIDFLTFRTLCYRYGSAVETITEHAYALMDISRDPAIIWGRAERFYQEDYEWLTESDRIIDCKT